MRMDWLRMLFSLCCQHALCAIPARVTALCHKRERCHREVTGQDTVEHMCWVILLIDHPVEVKAVSCLTIGICQAQMTQSPAATSFITQSLPGQEELNT